MRFEPERQAILRKRAQESMLFPLFDIRHWMMFFLLIQKTCICECVFFDCILDMPLFPCLDS